MQPAIEAETMEAIIRGGVPLIGAAGVTVRALGAGGAALLKSRHGDFVRPPGLLQRPARSGQPAPASGRRGPPSRSPLRLR